LDARVYLGNSGTNDVAKLITIGTPGSPLCDLNNICIPAVYDIRHGPPNTQSGRNGYTQFYTRAGNWAPFISSNCPQQDSLLIDEEEILTLVSLEYALMMNLYGYQVLKHKGTPITLHILLIVIQIF
jgi:hypothetical protein